MEIDNQEKNTDIDTLEPSANIYSQPFPKNTQLKGIVTEDSPAHTGPFKGAVDFLVEIGTPILAPADGLVIQVVCDHDRYGPTEEFVNDLNYVTILHSGEEFSQLAHLEYGSAYKFVKRGQKVRAGQQIGTSGLSGWMTEPHIHMLVYKCEKYTVGDKIWGFKSREIRFKAAEEKLHKYFKHISSWLKRI